METYSTKNFSQVITDERLGSSSACLTVCSHSDHRLYTAPWAVSTIICSVWEILLI